MSDLERKFGKYAIKNLTIILLACYVAGYMIQKIMPTLFAYLTLNPYAILNQGQIWRIFTWILIPPTSFDNGVDFFFIIIMLLFYYSLGTSLEHYWGAWKYNVFLFRGMLLTVLASFLCMAAYTISLELSAVQAANVFQYYSTFYSTYYINMSIFLAYALTFSEARVYIMFFLPVKVKWLGLLYAAMLTMQMLECFTEHNYFTVAAIGASLLNVLILWLMGKTHLTPKQIKRRTEFRTEVRASRKITTHRCAVCGQTEESNPDLEFRFCSKCNGNYEYCQNHLFTHEHVK